MAGIPIIKPNGRSREVFVERQGSRFMEDSYRYQSTSGLFIRSLDECFYHRYLAFLGISHTYEPDIDGVFKRPDFGVANNFLFELCRTNEAEPRDDDSRSDRWYKIKMSNKRQKYLDHGFNIVELHYNQVLINGHDASNQHVLFLIAKYNNHFRVPKNKDIHFKRLKGTGKPWKLKATFHYSDSEAEDIEKVVEHYKANRKYLG